MEQPTGARQGTFRRRVSPLPRAGGGCPHCGPETLPHRGTEQGGAATPPFPCKNDALVRITHAVAPPHFWGHVIVFYLSLLFLLVGVCIHAGVMECH